LRTVSPSSRQSIPGSCSAAAAGVGCLMLIMESKNGGAT
jgi:hypothetical protein